MNTRAHFLFCAVLVALISTNGIVSGSDRMHPIRPLRKGGLESRYLEVYYADGYFVDCTWPSSISTGGECKERMPQDPSYLTVEGLLQDARQSCHPSAKCKSGVCECNADTPDDETYGVCKTHKSRTDVDCKLEAELVRATRVYLSKFGWMQACMYPMFGGEGESCEADLYEPLHKKYGTTTKEKAEEKMTADEWIWWFSGWCFESASNKECKSGKCDCSVTDNANCKSHKRSLAPVNCKSQAEELVQSLAILAKVEDEFNRLARTSTKPKTKPTTKQPATSTAAKAHTTTPVLFLFWSLMSKAWAQLSSPLRINNFLNL